VDASVARFLRAEGSHISEDGLALSSAEGCLAGFRRPLLHCAEGALRGYFQSESHFCLTFLFFAEDVDV